MPPIINTVVRAPPRLASDPRYGEKTPSATLICGEQVAGKQDKATCTCSQAHEKQKRMRQQLIHTPGVLSFLSSFLDAHPGLERAETGCMDADEIAPLAGASRVYARNALSILPSIRPSIKSFTTGTYRADANTAAIASRTIGNSHQRVNGGVVHGKQMEVVLQRTLREAEWWRWMVLQY
jgi:hypothetical protein